MPENNNIKGKFNEYIRSKINLEKIKNNVQPTKKITIIHFLVILLGAIFISISCFHSNLWFDESYSVAIANHSFNEIWTIGGNDVHPILYYFLIRIVILLTNNNIVCVRLFSCLPLVIMSILGYTHIRKDFNEKIGLFFSFVTLFMPTCLVYSGEIRMYTWAMLFVFLTTIYGYRIVKNDVSKKNWILFSIFSLSSAYIHYYGLISAFVINIALIVYFIIKKHKNRINKIREINISKNLKYNIISAVVQVLTYLPWLGIVISQASGVSKGFWIITPGFLEILEFQFTGNLVDNIHLNKYIAYPFTFILFVYLIYMLMKNWKKEKPVKIALGIYLAVILIIMIISKVMKQSILYSRYFLNITGLIIFIFAYFLGNDKRKVRVIAICSLLVITSSIININLIRINYDSSNSKPIDYISCKIQKNDIILVDNNGSGFVLVAQLETKNKNVYFWDRKNWNVEEAYKAYGKTIYNLDCLRSYKGRIWALAANSFEFAETIKNELGGKIVDEQQFDVKYEHYQYSISLIEI